MRRAAAFLTLAAVLAVPAAAQRTGTRIGKDASAADGDVVARMLAACVIEKRPVEVRRWIELLPGTAAEQELVVKTRQSVEDCMEDDRLVLDNRSVTYRAPMMRRAIALAMVKQRLSRTPNPPAPAPGPVWYATQSRILPVNRGADGATLLNHSFGHCIAQADWANSIAVLRATADGPDERAALRRLAPAVGPCVPQGQQVALTPAMVRLSLAEPVYHLIAASSGSGN